MGSMRSNALNSYATKRPAKLKEREVNDIQFTKTQGKAAQKSKTKIVVKCNCGFPNNLFIRGEGITDLSWDKGIAMKNTKEDEWIWETDRPFSKAQFKIVLNDRQYECGENHMVECGKSLTLSPQF